MIEFPVVVAGVPVILRTHNLHLDEAGASLLISMFGTPAFVAKCCPNNVLELGQGGGLLDDHGSGGQPRKEDQCCMSLTAAELELDTDSSGFKKVLCYVCNEDNHAGSNKNELAMIFKFMQGQFPGNSYKVVEWAATGLLAKWHQPKGNKDFSLKGIKQAMVELAWDRAEYWYQAGLSAQKFQQDRFAQALADYNNPALTKFDNIRVGGKILKIVITQTRNSEFSKVARVKGAAVIIQQNPDTGNVQIFANHKDGIDLSDVVVVINLAEQIERGQVDKAGKPLITDRTILAQEGAIPGGVVWYYFKKMQALFNGSKSHDAVPATKLSLKKIRQLVLAALDPSRRKK